MPVVLAPLLVEVLLTFALLLCAGGGLAGAGRGVSPRSMAPGGLRADGCAAAYRAELELPVLLYVLTLVSIVTRHADLMFVMLAAVFVALRVLHAGVLVTGGAATGGAARRAGLLHVASAIVLAVAWGLFAISILLRV
ncbi:MAPEG family protein [Rhodovulum sp. PH10]|uniref:MAPEG family protein n=1 Tax=Rhodovulum sp. PH10 TaxID=1187851 RepID=UPI001ED9571C|nr:MAPEG family protein [Rhodovulum sp. PH10]